VNDGWMGHVPTQREVVRCPTQAKHSILGKEDARHGCAHTKVGRLIVDKRVCFVSTQGDAREQVRATWVKHIVHGDDRCMP